MPPPPNKIDTQDEEESSHKQKEMVPDPKFENLPNRYTLCLQDFAMKTAAGFIIGSMISGFFLRGNLARWPKFICGGLGFGMAYSNCENSLNEYLIALNPKPCPVKKRP